VFSPKKLSVIVAIIAAVSFAASATASAGRSSVTLVMPKSVPVNYTSCYNGSTALPCWTVNFTITNTTSKNLNCQVILADESQVVFDYTVPANTSTYGGGFTKGYVAGKKYLTLILSCGDGTTSYTDTRQVRLGSI
jgi:hypothetical protein